MFSSFAYRKFISICLIVLAMLCLVGCGRNKPQAKTDSNSQPLQVTDCTGTTVTLKQKPQRIVSMSISTDEILMELVEPSRIVAVTYLADDPGISNMTARAKAIKQRTENNPEAIVAMQPDLVIAPDFIAPEVIKTIRDLGLNLYVYKTQNSYAEIRQSILDIGKLVGESAKAQSMAQQMDQRLEKISAKLKAVPVQQRKRVAYVHAYGVYYSPASAYHDICRYAGVKDVIQELKFDRDCFVSKEVIVRLKPDFFIVTDWNYDGKHPAEAKINEILNDPAYADLPAIQQKRVYALPSAHLQSLSNFIVEASEDLAHIAYPELYN